MLIVRVVAITARIEAKLGCSSSEPCGSVSESESESKGWECRMRGTMSASPLAGVVGASALKIRIPDAMGLATTLSMFRWKIRIHQSAHIWRAAK